MTNPDNAIGTNAAYGTRTSVNAINDIAQLVNGRGILSGWAVVPKSGMTVSVGGVAGTRDVAIGEDNLGNRICLNNRLASSVDVTIAAASVSSARYDAIVVYSNNPAQAEDTTPDAPSVCGIIAVSGSASGVSEDQIRSAITADGGTGSTAYYAVLAQVYVGAGTTDITSANISQSHIAISASNIADGEIATDMLADDAVTREKIDWTSLASTQWVNGTYASGFTVSSNNGYVQGIQACIYAGFLYIRFGVSLSSGSFAAGTHYGIGLIPSTIDGIDVSALCSGTPGKANIPRFFCSGAGGAYGFCQLVGTGIGIQLQTTASWCCGEMMIPLNY